MALVSNNKFFIILMLLSFFTPYSLQFIFCLKPIDLVLDVVRVIFAALFICEFIKELIQRKPKLDAFLISLILLMTITVLSTIIHAGNIIAALKMVINSVSITLIVRHYSKNNYIKFYKCFYWLYFVLISLHVLTCFIFPNGINATNDYIPLNPLYFLFVDNGTALAVILFSLLTIIYSKITKNNIYYLGFILPIILFFLVSSANLKFVTILIFASLIFSKLLKNRLSFITIISLMFLFLGTIFLSSYSGNENLILLIIGKLTNRDVTFTGRTYLWQKGIQLFLKNPLLGQGIGFVDHIKIWNGYFTTHNLYIEYLVNSGIVGGILFGLVIFFVSKKILNNYNNSTYADIMFIFIALLAYFFVEAGINIVYYFCVFSIIYYLKDVIRKGVLMDYECIGNCTRI